jgi:GAF domain-containing protein
MVVSFRYGRLLGRAETTKETIRGSLSLAVPNAGRFSIVRGARSRDCKTTVTTPSPECGNDLERLRSDAEYMRFLVAAGELLSSSLDYRATLKNMCPAAVNAVADICILDIGGPQDIETIGAAHKIPELTPELEHAHEGLAHVPGRPAHPICLVLDSGQTFFAPRIDDAWIEQHASSPQHAEFMRRMKYRSMIVAPVRSLVWGIAGTLTLVRTDPTDRVYDRDAVLFAEELGRRCGVAIGKARLHSQTIDIAQRVQKAALPNALARVPGFTFDSLYEPADAALLVAGDWYDAFLLRDGNVGISIGDVCGHGIEAAALMSSIRNAIRMGVVIEPNLTQVLRHADFLFRNEAPSGMFCTALVGVIDRKTAQMTCVSAGHPGPLVWYRGRIDSPVQGSTVPLGIGDVTTETAEPVTFQLEPASTAVFFTDGLIEWRRDPVAGEDALRQALRDPAVRNAPSPARAIRDAVITGAHPDDLAILTVRYEGTE